jgi:hypothetical protein
VEFGAATTVVPFAGFAGRSTVIVAPFGPITPFANPWTETLPPACTPLMLAVIVVVPLPTAVTRPLLDTVATEVLPDVHTAVGN